MPKIIKQGHLPEKMKFISTCSHCKTEFSFLREEASDGSGGDPRDHGVLKIPCPLCSRDVYTNARQGIPTD